MFSAEYIVTRGYRYTLLADIAAAAKHQPTIHEYPHRKHPDTTTSSTNSHRQNGQIKELVSAQPVEEGPQERKEVKDGKRDAA
ncbi:hypothetical protein Vi05172_g12555 [Venturia inaequalis]|nr:hypothetical protein Vi05172_g12555 [Venturia inaequalis]